MNNFINDIEINNFKSIRHQKIEGCKKVNVFIGYPNVGKSNILEAIALGSIFQYQGIRNDFKLTDIIRLNFFYEIFYEGNSEIETGIAINNRKFIFNITVDKAFDRLIAVFIYKHSSSYTNSAYQLIASQFPLLFNIDRKFAIKSESLQQLVSHLQKNSGANREILNDFINIKKYHFKEVTKNNKRGGTLSFPFGENLMTILSEDPKIKNEVAVLFEQYNWKLLFDTSEQSLKLFRQLSKDTIFSLSYDLTADTLQRLIFYKTAIATNKNSVLLFEEPEAHYFEPYISEFTNAIKYDGNHNQYFIVTHSQFVIDELLRDEESRNNTNLYLVNNVNSETKVKLLDPQNNIDVFERGLNVFFNFDNLWNSK